MSAAGRRTPHMLRLLVEDMRQRLAEHRAVLNRLREDSNAAGNPYTRYKRLQVEMRALRRLYRLDDLKAGYCRRLRGVEVAE